MSQTLDVPRLDTATIGQTAVSARNSAHSTGTYQLQGVFAGCLRRFSTVEQGKTLHKYWSLAYPRCPIKAQCTRGDYRRIHRWEHEHVLDAMQERLDRQPEMMRIRRRTVEHTFGTLKHWMGLIHFLTKRLPNVKTEMSLHVLAYNLKRAMQIFGVSELLQTLQA